MLSKKWYLSILALIAGLFIFNAHASKLVEVRLVDNQYVMLWFYDGEVKFVDDGQGAKAFTNYGGSSEFNNYIVEYGEALDTSEIRVLENYTITSDEDSNYGTEGQNATTVYVKTKPNGQAELEWMDNVPYNSFGDYNYQYTYQHWVYVKMPSPLQQGKTYTIDIAAATNSDSSSVTFTYDFFTMRSEAVHVNVVGYSDAGTIKAADVYHWMGDGGGRDFSDYNGNKVYLYDVNTSDTIPVGKLNYYMKSAGEMAVGGYDYIKAHVWTADFTGYDTPGTYRLAVEGIGCSDEFEISETIYKDPYDVMVQGFYYMRAGEDSTHGLPLVPRRPLWIPGEDPSDFKIYITNMDPYHPSWFSFKGGDKWDSPGNSWDPYIKEGSPTNPNAVGGHVDALDWDRHLGHVSIIYDMLLPYILTNGAIDDDNTGIAESGNGIPDIIDEARNEVDFWLLLRDGAGYAHGLTNPNDQNEMFQAGTTGMAAWANAANSAMLAYAFKVAGETDLMNEYADSAIAAYNYASALPSNQSNLNDKWGIGEDLMMGKDFKMMAAAYLYNITGNTYYEDMLNGLSVVNSPTSIINKRDNWNQVWATVGYLLTPQTINYPELYNNMNASMVHQAYQKEAKWSETRATRRGNDNNHGYYPTVQFINRTIIAHAITSDPELKELFANTLTLEADFSLGRNGANMIQMTTATTALENENSTVNIYTNGRDDGVPGLNPGHTPYYNDDDWAASMIMGSPGKVLDQTLYPDDGQWPKAEKFIDTRYVWAHTEFTPQQTMRGKMALYGYLYGLNRMKADNIVIPATGFELDTDTIRFFPDNTRKINYVLYPANANDKDVVWSSEDISIATVDTTGTVKGVSPDTTWVYAEHAGTGYKDSCLIIVKPIDFPVTSVELNEDTAKILAYSSFQLVPTILPTNASDTSVIWWSQYDSIATVDEMGKVTGVNTGETYIYVETINENKIDSCLIEVVKLPSLLAYIDFDSEESGVVTDNIGNDNNATLMGDASLTPSIAGQAADFDGSGDYAVIPHSDVFVWNGQNNFSISFWVYVDNFSNNWTGLVTKSRDISPYSGIWISPSNNWHSANTGIQESASGVVPGKWNHVVAVQNAEESAYYLYVNSKLLESGTPVAETGMGDIWIGGAASTAEFFDGKIDELYIYSIPLTGTQVDSLYNIVAADAQVLGVSIDAETVNLNVGETFQLTATVTPEVVVDNKVNWSINNQDVATVSSSGLVTAVGNGTATIKAQTRTGAKNAFCSVVVTGGTSVHSISDNHFTLYPNPTKDNITIELKSNNVNVSYQIHSITGTVLEVGNIISGQKTIDLQNLEKGIYLLKINDRKYNGVIKFIKE